MNQLDSRYLQIINRIALSIRFVIDNLFYAGSDNKFGAIDTRTHGDIQGAAFKGNSDSGSVSNCVLFCVNGSDTSTPFGIFDTAMLIALCQFGRGTVVADGNNPGIFGDNGPNL